MTEIGRMLPADYRGVYAAAAREDAAAEIM
jgi:hypothetical protein